MDDPTSQRSDEALEQRHQRQGDLVIKGFEILCRKWQPGPTFIKAGSLSVDEVNSQEALLDRLHSRLLPDLSLQLNALLRSLDSTKLRKEPESQLSRMLELQSEFDHNLSQIQYIVNVLCPGPLHASNRVDDQELKQFKSYRINDLEEKTNGIVFQMPYIFYQVQMQIQQMNLSTETEMFETDEAIHDIAIREGLDMIQSAIKCFGGSELDVVEDRWKWNIIRSICYSTRPPA
ncbi:hypothetical protein H4Q26_004625 [Puccinia striiformis f. sp. tritici PST-130]|nr:hypothetical protein H4Q26_004625 [Puccinia striiformis f. sp. tritici PST-130]